MRRSNNKGFTLIELLVVISIIALLMSMLMPALAKVRDQAKTIVCLANLKQFGIGFNLYLESNNGHFMDDDHTWYDELMPIVQEKKLYMCPKATKTIREGARIAYSAFVVHEDSEDEIRGSYGLNDWLLTDWDGDSSSSHPLEDFLWKTSEVKKAYNIPILSGCSRMNIMTVSFGDEPPAYEGDVEGFMLILYYWISAIRKHTLWIYGIMTGIETGIQIICPSL